MNYKEYSTRTFRRFLDEGSGDYVIVIVPLGRPNQYVVFQEDAYEIEPWHSGLKVLTKEQIKEEYNIEL